MFVKLQLSVHNTFIRSGSPGETSLKAASMKDAADAVYMEQSNDDFGLSPNVMPNPKSKRSRPRKIRVSFCRIPRTKVNPKTVSAMVTTQTIAGIKSSGTHGLNCAL